MSDIENFEIRCCLVGEEFVGKKSLISRFKILNTSQTLEGNEYDFNSKSKAELKEIPKHLTETFFSKKYSNREKQKLQSLINFSKILTVSKFNLEFRFFPISPADILQFNDPLNEEAEDSPEKNHKMKFDNIKQELERIIMKQPRQQGEVKMFFMFVFDLGNFVTFDKIKIYYEELNKYLNISKQHVKVLIGNKVDVKIPFNSGQKEIMLSFITENNFQYYEVSTKMFFNFEKFFERMFFETFSNVREDFSESYFKERFNYILQYRPNFAKAERGALKCNNYPGPEKYDMNVYDLQNPEEYKSAFERKERFKKKIFVNKLGPVFDYKKEDFLKKQKKKESKKEVTKHHSDLNKNKENKLLTEEDKKKKMKEIAMNQGGQNGGYSMGIQKSKLNLRKQRKEEYRSMMRSFENLFDFENITNAKPLEKKVRSVSAKSRKETMKKEKQIKLQQTRAKSSKKTDPHKTTLKFSKKPTKESMKRKETKEEKTESKNSSFDYHRDKSKSHSHIGRPNAIKRARSHRIVKKDPFIVPGPATYDVTGKINLNKGFTFGGRYVSNEMKNRYAPAYVSIKSDIDVMLEKPKFGFKKSFAPRFKEPKIEEVGDIKDILKKFDNMGEIKFEKLEEKLEKLKDRNNKAERVMDRKAELEEIKRRKYENYDVIYDINYALVEECPASV
jgi:hypothetical protein